MPPRHTYWTIILEGKPTAFRAHTPDELLPTASAVKEQVIVMVVAPNVRRTQTFSPALNP